MLPNKCWWVAKISLQLYSLILPQPTQVLYCTNCTCSKSAMLKRCDIGEYEKEGDALPSSIVASETGLHCRPLL